MSSTPTDPLAVGASSSALGRAVRTLLAPLVRLLLERQFTFPYVANLLKSVFVEVAERHFTLAGRRQTDSRISLLTGIHRKDVKRLRRRLAEDRPIPITVSLGALAVSRWLADRDYLDADGRPLALGRGNEAGEGPSFESLIASVSKDIPPRSVLDEWLRLGVVELDECDRVRLRADSFIPERGIEEKTHFFGRNLRDHIAAGVHNLLGEGPSFLDRSVYYDELTAESVAELAEWARQQGSQLIRAVNRRALELQTRDAGASGATHRMTFGAYFYAAEEPEERGESESAEDRDAE